MSDYISREDAKKKHCDICRETSVCYRDYKTCKELSSFDAIQATDVVEVVRCRECKHSGKIYSTGGYIDCAYTQRLHEPDFYCADGERKGGEDDE